ncbi:MAG: hypothetical protein ACREA2_24825 [Blastocatellia bacterium]
MIIYVAPKDADMYKRTLKYAQENKIRMIVVNESGLFEEVNKAKSYHYDSSQTYMFGEAETMWIVGHGNTEEIGDKKGGVTITADSLVSFLKSTVIAQGNKYRGSIVIDTCKSGVRNDQKTTFADRVFNGLTSDFPKATVGGWIGSVHGRISGGRIELMGQEFSGDEGFAWANRKRPEVGDHDVLAKLA